jgi:hypothetical protein
MLAGMAELALDDVERHSLTGEPDGVRMTELMWCKASPDASFAGVAAKLAADRGSRPRPTAGGAVDHAKQRAPRQLKARREPGPQVLPAPRVHPDFASASALAARRTRTELRCVEHATVGSSKDAAEEMRGGGKQSARVESCSHDGPKRNVGGWT